MTEQSTQIATIIPESLSVITYNDTPVITTELLASVYGTESIRIQQNHARNQERFISGKHYFKVSGKALKDLRLSLSESQISPMVRSLILWTVRGAARHAKMLDTDKAWDMFEKMEDCYFSQKEAAALPASRPEKTRKALPNGLSIEQQEIIKQIIKDKADALPLQKRKNATITCWSALKAKFGVTYKEIAPEHFTDAVSLISRLELEGEYIPAKPEPEFRESANLSNFSDDELCTLLWLWNAAGYMVASIEEITPLLKAVEHRLTSRFITMAREYSKIIEESKPILVRETAHIPYQPERDNDWSRALKRLR